MSFFTIKEIDMHWPETLYRGRKFKEERDVVET